MNCNTSKNKNVVVSQIDLLNFRKDSLKKELEYLKNCKSEIVDDDVYLLFCLNSINSINIEISNIDNVLTELENTLYEFSKDDCEVVNE